jgi:GTPase SAR1 family protein
MGRVYLKGACGAMLVYDVNDRVSFNALPKWVHRMQRASIPSLVIGTHLPSGPCLLLF